MVDLDLAMPQIRIFNSIPSICDILKNPPNSHASQVQPLLNGSQAKQVAMMQLIVGSFTSFVKAKNWKLNFKLKIHQVEAINLQETSLKNQDKHHLETKMESDVVSHLTNMDNDGLWNPIVHQQKYFQRNFKIHERVLKQTSRKMICYKEALKQHEFIFISTNAISHHHVKYIIH